MQQLSDKATQAGIGRLKDVSKDLDEKLARIEKRHGVKLNGHLRVGNTILWVRHVPTSGDIPFIAQFLQQITDQGLRLPDDPAKETEMLTNQQIASLQVGDVMVIEGDESGGLYEYGGKLPDGTHVIKPVHDDKMENFAVDNANLKNFSFEEDVQPPKEPEGQG